jgi:hypothetical protein
MDCVRFVQPRHPKKRARPWLAWEQRHDRQLLSGGCTPTPTELFSVAIACSAAQSVLAGTAHLCVSTLIPNLTLGPSQS